MVKVAITRYSFERRRYDHRKEILDVKSLNQSKRLLCKVNIEDRRYVIKQAGNQQQGTSDELGTSTVKGNAIDGTMHLYNKVFGFRDGGEGLHSGAHRRELHGDGRLLFTSCEKTKRNWLRWPVFDERQRTTKIYSLHTLIVGAIKRY